MHQQALRVLGIAVIPLMRVEVTRLAQLESADEKLAYYRSGNVVLLGFLGSLDPPRNGVKAAIQKCREAGVQVVMITGDQVNTAAAVGKQIDLIESVMSFTLEHACLYVPISEGRVFLV